MANFNVPAEYTRKGNFTHMHKVHEIKDDEVFSYGQFSSK